MLSNSENLRELTSQRFSYPPAPSNSASFRSLGTAQRSHAHPPQSLPMKEAALHFPQESTTTSRATPSSKFGRPAAVATIFLPGFGPRFRRGINFGWWCSSHISLLHQFLKSCASLGPNAINQRDRTTTSAFTGIFTWSLTTATLPFAFIEGRTYVSTSGRAEALACTRIRPSCAPVPTGIQSAAHMGFSQ